MKPCAREVETVPVSYNTPTVLLVFIGDKNNYQVILHFIELP
jgi:hypothetical protein